MSQLAIQGLFTNALIQEVLLAMRQTLGSAIMTDTQVMLYQNSIVPSKDVTYTQLTECNFDGYERVTTATWTEPYLNLNGLEVIAPSLVPTFTCNGTLTANTVYGVGITDPTGTVLYALGNIISAPFTPITGNIFDVTPELSPTGVETGCVC